MGVLEARGGPGGLGGGAGQTRGDGGAGPEKKMAGADRIFQRGGRWRRGGAGGTAPSDLPG